MASAPFRFRWTPEAVSDFWNRYLDQPGIENHYFALQRGTGIFRYMDKLIRPWEGPVVDIGCGQGHMLSLLLKKNIPSIGLDTSAKALEATGQKLSNHPDFLGVRLMQQIDRLPLEDQSVAGVILMETIEHLFEDHILPLLLEIRRVLKPGGFVFITTPNNENLKAKEVCCSHCSCVFHPVQHLRSWDAGSLSAVMQNAGFKCQICQPVIFLPDWRVYLKQFKYKMQIPCPSCGQFFDAPTHSGITQLKNLQIRNLVYLGRA